MTAARLTRSVFGASLAGVVVRLAAIAFAIWEGTLRRTQASAHWSVLATIAAGVAAAVLLGRGRQRATSGAWLRSGGATILGDLSRPAGGRRAAPLIAATAVWVLLICAVIGWDLYSFAREVPYLPTLSRLFGDVTRYEWGRALVFAGWLALGADLAAGWRRPAGHSSLERGHEAGAAT